MVGAGAKRVIAADLSAAQIACLELRVAAYRTLKHREFLELLGQIDSADRTRLSIELPNIELRSIHTSVAVYAMSALRSIARRNMGGPGAWKGWFKKWKHIHDVRVAQAAEQTASE